MSNNEHKGLKMLNNHMTEKDYKEYLYHNCLHDMAELVLLYGYDKVIEDLAEILNSRCDNMEPVCENI